MKSISEAYNKVLVKEGMQPVAAPTNLAQQPRQQGAVSLESLNQKLDQLLAYVQQMANQGVKHQG